MSAPDVGARIQSALAVARTRLEAQVDHWTKLRRNASESDRRMRCAGALITGAALGRLVNRLAR